MKKVFIVMFIISIFSCENRKLTNHNERINNFIIENQSQKDFIIVLDTISSFEWDELIAVGPYVNLEKVSSESEYNLKKFPNLIKHHDGFILIGFINNKKAVKYMEFNRYFLNDSIFIDSGKSYKLYKKNKSNLRIIKN